MEGKKQYWPDGYVQSPIGFDLEARSHLALFFIEKIIMGKRGSEDSQDRAAIEEMPATEIVERAFEMADAFVSIAEGRGEIREHDAEAAFKRGGELASIRNEAGADALFQRSRKRQQDREVSALSSGARTIAPRAD